MWPFVSGIVSQKAKHLCLFAICNIFLIELSVQIFAYFFSWVAFSCSSSRVLVTFCIQAPLCVLQVFFFPTCGLLFIFVIHEHVKV